MCYSLRCILVMIDCNSFLPRSTNRITVYWTRKKKALKHEKIVLNSLETFILICYIFCSMSFIYVLIHERLAEVKTAHYGKDKVGQWLNLIQGPH